VLLVHQFDALSLAFVYFKTDKTGFNSVTDSLHEWSVFAKILYHWVSHMFSYFGIGNKTVVGLRYGDDACAWIKALWDIFGKTNHRILLTTCFRLLQHFLNCMYQLISISIMSNSTFILI